MFLKLSITARAITAWCRSKIPMPGSVSEVYDLIMKHRMFIVGAADIPVRHCLVPRKGDGCGQKGALEA